MRKQGGAMSDRISLLIKIFRIELEEAENDIQALMEYYSERFDNKEITTYVWQENQALLSKEVSCIKELEGDLKEWKQPAGVTEIQAVLLALSNYLHELVTKHGYPELVNIVIDRITEKVSRYIE